MFGTSSFMFLGRISAEIQFLVKDSDVVGSRTIGAVGVQVEKLARECNQQQADSGSGYYVMRWIKMCGIRGSGVLENNVLELHLIDFMFVSVGYEKCGYGSWFDSYSIAPSFFQLSQSLVHKGIAQVTSWLGLIVDSRARISIYTLVNEFTLIDRKAGAECTFQLSTITRSERVNRNECISGRVLCKGESCVQEMLWMLKSVSPEQFITVANSIGAAKTQDRKQPVVKVTSDPYVTVSVASEFFLVKDSDVVGSRTIGAVGVQVEKLARECNQQQADSGSGYYVMRWMYDFVNTHQIHFPKTAHMELEKDNLLKRSMIITKWWAKHQGHIVNIRAGLTGYSMEIMTLATSSHGGGLAHSHGYNPFGPPLGGDSRGFTGFYHQFRRPLHGGGRGFMPLLYDNQYGPPCGPMASMSNVSHVFVSASFQPFSHQFRTPHGGDGPRFMRNVFHMLRAEATSFQPLAGHEEQVEAAAPLDDFPPLNISNQ
ncbi:phospholipase D gamma 1-like protein [Tanacetum coccineum]|uniref:Phospholipase D gamma 1-like protein n=1 Tax=Tanacetum coccineum TaxID=301880 RepID=A0ABQ5D567_9ASTR